MMKLILKRKESRRQGRKTCVSLEIISSMKNDSEIK